MPIDETLDARLARLEQALQDEHDRRERLEARQRRWTRAAKLGAAAMLAIGTLSYGVRTALAAGNCNQTLPAPLTTFCAGTPALASEINGDFQGVVDKLVSKVGPWASTDATMNAATMKSATVSGNLTVMGSGAVTGTVQAANVTAIGTVTGAAVTATGTVTGAAVKATGDVTVGGKVLFGWTIKPCNNTTSCTCPVGTSPVGGGVDCSNGNGVKVSRYGGQFNWIGSCTSGASPIEINVVCARVGS